MQGIEKVWRQKFKQSQTHSDKSEIVRCSVKKFQEVNMEENWELKII